MFTDRDFMPGEFVQIIDPLAWMPTNIVVGSKLAKIRVKQTGPGKRWHEGQATQEVLLKVSIANLPARILAIVPGDPLGPVHIQFPFAIVPEPAFNPLKRRYKASYRQVRPIFIAEYLAMLYGPTSGLYGLILDPEATLLPVDWRWRHQDGRGQLVEMKKA